MRRKLLCHSSLLKKIACEIFYHGWLLVIAGWESIPAGLLMRRMSLSSYHLQGSHWCACQPFLLTAGNLSNVSSLKTASMYHQHPASHCQWPLTIQRDVFLCGAFCKSFWSIPKKFGRYLSKRCPACFTNLKPSFHGFLLLFRHRRQDRMFDQFIFDNPDIFVRSEFDPSSRILYAVHGIQMFQKLREPRKDLDVCLKAISPQNLLCFLPINAASIFGSLVKPTTVFPQVKCIDRCTFFIEGHIHLIRHQILPACSISLHTPAVRPAFARKITIRLLPWICTPEGSRQQQRSPSISSV